MSSNKERREVAKRLRFCAKTTNGTIELSIGLSHWVGIDGVTDDQGNLFSTKADCREAELTLEKLADRIDREMVELPKDADGKPIRIGDTVYANDGSEFRVCSITVTSEGSAIGVNPLDGFCFCPSMKPERLSHRAPEPSDSWEKLEEDALKYQCSYFFGISEDKNTTCVNCKKSSEVTGIPCRLNMQIDLVKRAKLLAGIEEQEASDD